MARIADPFPIERRSAPRRRSDILTGPVNPD